MLTAQFCCRINVILLQKVMIKKDDAETNMHESISGIVALIMILAFAHALYLSYSAF